MIQYVSIQLEGGAEGAQGRTNRLVVTTSVGMFDYDGKLVIGTVVGISAPTAAQVTDMLDTEAF